MPQPTAKLTATIQTGYFYDPSKGLPQTFPIDVWPDHLVINGTSVPANAAGGYVAMPNDRSFTFILNPVAPGQWEWSYNGLAGQAIGTAVPR